MILGGTADAKKLLAKLYDLIGCRQPRANRISPLNGRKKQIARRRNQLA
jgi:hypothetical protein